MTFDDYRGGSTRRVGGDPRADSFGSTNVTRRAFLKLSALAAVPLLLPKAPVAAYLDRDALLSDPPPASLGRIATWWRQAIREEPSEGAKALAWKSRDDLVPLYASVTGEAPWPTNPVWYQTEGGYIHSGYVQPVENESQGVISEVAPPGFWAQVSVPWAEARTSPASAYVLHKLYYGTVYRVVAVVSDDGGNAWYQLKEGVSPWRSGPYVLASTLRPIPPEALAPISQGHPDKWIQIDLAAQRLTCLEGDVAVFSTSISSGHRATATPRGEFRVLYKRHARRMTMSGIADPYDLPGVPFVVYFTWRGVAIHGTYWHNDYGRVHSHGCVNATPDAAQWIYRWVDPVAPYEAYTTDADPAEAGTRIVVV